MITRRSVVALALGVVAASASSLAQAPDWKSKYPELVLAVIPAENGSGVSERFAPFVAYLSKELGTKVTLRIAQDYAAVIEGQRSGQVHIGYIPMPSPPAHDAAASGLSRRQGSVSSIN